jgi:hypothetical protein
MISKFRSQRSGRVSVTSPKVTSTYTHCAPLVMAALPCISIWQVRDTNQIHVRYIHAMSMVIHPDISIFITKPSLDLVPRGHFPVLSSRYNQAFFGTPV